MAYSAVRSAYVTGRDISFNEKLISFTTLTILAPFLITVQPAHAQILYESIVGNVTDPSSAAISATKAIKVPDCARKQAKNCLLRHLVYVILASNPEAPMIRQQRTRREVIENCISRGLLIAAAPMTGSRLFSLWAESENHAAKPTPTEVLGPFYKKGAPNTSMLRAPGDKGFPLRVAGKVSNTRGEAVQSVNIDIWHADDQGHYDVQGYRYRTRLVVETASEYAIESVMPGHYDDRPAQHIHYMISAPGHKTLITQLYFATDPFFEGDPDRRYQKRSIVSHRELIRPVMLYERPAAAAHAVVTFDICLEKA
jgi:protocatechuate 3,4-dioxygenase beta subunit